MKDTTDTPMQMRLNRLRDELSRLGVDGFIQPRADEHQGEYVPPRAERLRWLTGFSGSAGSVVVLADQARIFVDGRYTLQVETEVDTALFKPCNTGDVTPAKWIAEHMGAGTRLGYDPKLTTAPGRTRLEDACRKAGATLVALADNPIDAVWDDQPAPPTSPAMPHPAAFAGEPAATKRSTLAATLAAQKVDAVFLSAPDSICWLLNIRGGDVAYSPLCLAFALLDASGRVRLFADDKKFPAETRAHMGAEVTIAAPQSMADALDALGAKGAIVLAPDDTTSVWVIDRLKTAGAAVITGPDPCELPKACKNKTEVDGMRAAHVRDGAALSRFLAWLETAAPQGGVTEIAAADKLETMRAEGDHFRGLSFPTISGAGANGAIVHYHATEQTNRTLERGTLYLVDSGAQYEDGTTDVTRTVFIGTDGDVPDDDMKDHFTRVLKGHIALARAIFPTGTTGHELDALARRPLWDIGLDYDHGTGHGVGSYLGVHEGPQRISKRASGVALKEGMVISNEPGYYKTGAYGIRIENLVLVKSVESPGDREMMGFEELTLAPIARDLIVVDMLSTAERAWLDAYHARVRETLSPLLPEDVRAWLEGATAPIIG